MTDLDAASARNLDAGGGAHAAPPTDEPPAGVGQAAANPALVGVPTFVIGSVALGLYLIGFKGSDLSLIHI